MSISRKFEKFNFFSVQWSYEDEDTDPAPQCIIRIYGFNERNESVYVRVEDFEIPLYVELPEHIEWTDARLRVICNYLYNLNRRKGMQPSIEFQAKHRSHYAYVDKINNPKGDIKYNKKLFPYLKVSFRTVKGCDYFVNALRRDITITGIGQLRLKCHGAESTVTPVYKLIAINKLNSAGWMKVVGIPVSKENKESTKSKEYIVEYKNLISMSEEESMKMPIVSPKVLSFDNEANSTIISSMPKSHRPGDKVFQIGYTILEPPREFKPKNYKKVLLSLGDPDPIEDVIVKKCKTEADLMIQLAKDIVDEDPDVIIGFNILGWDINYMIERCKNIHFCLSEFDIFGCIEGKHAKEELITWSSSAYGKQEFKFLNAEGRLFIDMLPYVKNNYKLPNYRLETICEEFLKTNKDPLKAKDIFKCYREFSSSSLALVGKYCVQDSYVTLLLYEKLLTWFNLTESASTNHVPMFDMITKGQQIKMYAQVYQYCYHNNIVVESNAYKAKDDEHYTGAYVSEPIKGLYDMVIPFDFASLYPSIMMAYNIDYSKLVIDESIPDEDCHVMSWSEHAYCNCPLDTKIGKKAPVMKDGKVKRVCSDYKYRWLKHKVSGKGTIPTLLENLISARKKTRKVISDNEVEYKLLKKFINMEKLTDENISNWNDRINKYLNNKENIQAIEIIRKSFMDDLSNCYNVSLNEEEIQIIKDRIDSLETLNLVLDRRQNAYKVNANSMYGAMGVSKGYLPFLPGAMCVTFTGRESILKVNKYIEDVHKGRVIYNDTDSAYCHFPEFKGTSSELWAYANMIVDKVKVMFPPPMSLEFESKIYKKFLILTKKRYVAQAINEEGKVDSKLMKRGIILQRRDNCVILRDVYQALVMDIFKYHEILVGLKNIKDVQEIYRIPEVQKLLNMITFAIDTLFQRGDNRYWKNDKDSLKKYSHRDFIITKQMTKTPSEYKNPNKLPSHVLLGLKMQNRGVPVGAGTRIEYLICNNGSYKKTDTQKNKLCDIDYYNEFKDIIMIDYLSYMKTFINPLDEICNVVMNIKGFVKNQFEDRIKYSKVIERIKELGRPHIQFKE